MAVPTSLIPVTPISLSTSAVLGASAPVTSTVTLTTPTSAAIITGLNTPVAITVPALGSYIRVKAYLPSVTQSAAAATTICLYSGATAGALTTLVQSVNYTTATGGTSIGGVFEFLVPVTAAGTTFPQAGSSIFLSIAATDSTGNFVVNGAAATPASMIVEVL